MSLHFSCSHGFWEKIGCNSYLCSPISKIFFPLTSFKILIHIYIRYKYQILKRGWRIGFPLYCPGNVWDEIQKNLFVDDRSYVFSYFRGSFPPWNRKNNRSMLKVLPWFWSGKTGHSGFIQIANFISMEESLEYCGICPSFLLKELEKFILILWDRDQ